MIVICYLDLSCCIEYRPTIIIVRQDKYIIYHSTVDM